MQSISKFIFLFTALFQGLSFVAAADETKKAAAPEKEKLQIKSHRFSRHAGQDFERLVIEFSGKHTAKSMPIKLVSNPVEKNANITVDGLTLVGAIPEAGINDSFVGKSKYLGPVSINPEVNGTVLRTSYKDATVSIDAFWLESPSRLVIDAFPPASPRAVGPAVIGDNTPKKAAVEIKKQPKVKLLPPEPVKAKTSAAPVILEKPRSVAANEKVILAVANASAQAESKAVVKSGPRTHKFLCFPATSQVSTSVTYEDKKGKTQPQLDVETTGHAALTPTVTSPDGVVCYPRSAELKAVVHFTKTHPETTATEQKPDETASVETDSATPAAESRATGPKGPVEPDAKKPEQSAARQAPVSPTANGNSVSVPTPLKRTLTSMPPFLPTPSGMGRVPPMTPPSSSTPETKKSDEEIEKEKKTLDE